MDEGNDSSSLEEAEVVDISNNDDYFRFVYDVEDDLNKNSLFETEATADRNNNNNNNNVVGKDESGKTLMKLANFYPLHGRPFLSFLPSVEYASIAR